MRMCVMAVVMILAGISVAAQTKTVTNTDLYKYREKRVAAERDYRENYAKMGFPSPEELEKQAEKSGVERQELSARLRAERLERERNALNAESARRQYEMLYIVPGIGQQNSGAYIPYYWPGNYWWYKRGLRPVVRYPYPSNIGNGIPLVNYYETPSNIPYRVPRFSRVH